MGRCCERGSRGRLAHGWTQSGSTRPVDGQRDECGVGEGRLAVAVAAVGGRGGCAVSRATRSEPGTAEGARRGPTAPSPPSPDVDARQPVHAREGLVQVVAGPRIVVLVRRGVRRVG